MRVLVTGGSGYAGSWLVRTLVARGDAVVNFDLLPFPDPNVPVADVRGDLRSKDDVVRACQGIEVIVHAAARVPLTKAGREFYDVNVGGTRTILAVAQQQGVRKVVHISSSAVFGVPAESPVTADTPRRPVDPYGRSKALAEEVCEASRRQGLDVVILRPRTIVGPERLGIFQILFEWIAHDHPVYLIGSGANRLQLVSAADFCTACVLAIDRAHAITLGIGGRAFGTLREDLGALIAHAKSRSRIVSLPVFSTITALRALDWLRLSPLAPWHYLTFHADFFYDESATALLGFQPRESNHDILVQAYDWYLQHGTFVRNAALSPHRSAPKLRFLRLLKRLAVTHEH